MKIRNGFVSNSSSSSFICDICGHTETVYDSSYEDAGFFQCENGHIICDSESLGVEKVESNYYGSCLSSECCPICQFEVAGNNDIKRYFLKTTEFTEAEVLVEVKKINKRRKKLYPSEYVNYVCVKTGVTETELLLKIKKQFKNYKKFQAFLDKE